MFEINPNNPHLYRFIKPAPLPNNNVELVYRAVRLFNTAISRGRFARVKWLVTHTSGQLLDLNMIPGLHARAQYYDGLRPVAIKDICGSFGRTTDFDCDFNPLDNRLRDRWQNIAIAHLHNIGLSPVDLIQVGECYFVKDGHHRISVARALGQYAIDAEVTVWDVLMNLSLENAQPADAQVQIIQTIS